jgi:hypothetical protein
MGAEARIASRSAWSAPEEGAFLLRRILWCVDRLRAPLAAIGVDHARFRELLRVRILLTQRATSASSKAWGTAGAAIALLVSWFFGLVTGLTAVLTENGALWVAVSLSLSMLILAVLLFQVLAGILVDPTDIGVVAPHPIPDRTVFAVRLAEVSVYVLAYVASFTAGNLFLALFALPPLAVLFVYPILSLLAGVVTLGLVTALFAACLRLVGPTHFQRVTLWLQIVGGVSIFVGFQATRLVPREQWALWFEEHEGLRFLLPPLQYAELFAFASGAESRFPVAAGLAAVLAPAAALAVTFALASRYFVAGLQGTLGAPARRGGWERGLLGRAGAYLAGREERAGFDFALALSRREPHALRAVLPQLVMFQMMTLGAGFGLRRDLAYLLPASAGFLFMILPNVLLQSQGTPVPEARALFETLPLESEKAFLRGGVKALLAQWIGVPAVVLFAIQLWAAGPRALPRIVLAFALALAAALLFTRLFRLGVPFTQPIRVGEAGVANLGIILLMGLGMGALVGVHVALSLHALSLAGGIAGSGLLLALLWRRLGGLEVAPERRLHAERPRLWPE